MSRRSFAPLARVLACAVACAALGSLAPDAHAGAADVAPGSLRTPTSRVGAVLREEGRMGSKVLGNVPHGTRLMVQEVQGKWIRVTTPLAGTSTTGWLKADDTVEPYALTGAGRSATVGTGTGPRDAAGDVSAAARGFGPGIEAQAALSDARLRAGLALVDRIEAVKPTPEEVSAFSKQGRLGIPGKTR
jgi:hypothetical protein